MGKYQIQKSVSVDEYVGMKIRELRESKGYTQEQLINVLTIGRTSLSNIEVGKQKLTLRNIEEICEALQCKSSDILPF